MTDCKKQVDLNRERERKIALSKCLKAKKKGKNKPVVQVKAKKKHKVKHQHKPMDGEYQRVMALTRKTLKRTFFLDHPTDDYGPL